MGLERVAYLLQGVDNLYEIDQVYPVIKHAAELAGKRYGDDHADDVRLRVVADHVRSGLMLIADGVTPGNEARGYVLRRLLRRVIRSMRLLGVAEPVLPELLPVSRDLMSESYPEVESDWARTASGYHPQASCPQGKETLPCASATGTSHSSSIGIVNGLVSRVRPA